MSTSERTALRIAVALSLGLSVSAHDFSQSESTIEIDGREARVSLSVNLLELPDVDTSRDGRVSYEELDKAIERVVALLEQHYVVRAPDPPRRISVDRYEIAEDHVLRLNIREEFEHGIKALDVTSTLDSVVGPAHQHFLTASINGEMRRAVLDATGRSVRLEVRRLTRGRIGAVVAALLGIGGLAAYRKWPRGRGSQSH